jgi:hypothetical protein
MRQRLAIIAIPMAAVWFLSAAAVAKACVRCGPPSVGAGTGRLKIEIKADTRTAQPGLGSTPAN